METNCKIIRKTRVRAGDGVKFLLLFVQATLMVVLSYDMWKSILNAFNYNNWRLYDPLQVTAGIIGATFIILLVIRLLLFFLDLAIWRMCGIEILEIDSIGIRYIKKGRLIKQTIYIPIENVLSISTTEYKKKYIDIEDDQGRITIEYKRFIFGLKFITQINLGTKFSNEDIDNILSVYSSIKNGS